MSFKYISYLELWQPFCSMEQNYLCFLVEGEMRNNSVNHFEFGPVVQMLFKISYLELWRPSCSVERNHLCIFQHSCEVN